MPAARFLAASLVAVALTATTGAGAASAASSYRIAVTEKSTFVAQDLGATGFSIGDHLVYSSVFTNRTGKKVGDGGGDCIAISGTSDKTATYSCVGTNRFGKSTLSISGLYDASSTGQQQLAITGGTGKYANARGVEELRTLPGDQFADVFRFTT